MAMNAANYEQDRSDILDARVDSAPLLTERLQSWHQAVQIVLEYANQEYSTQTSLAGHIAKQRKSLINIPSFTGSSVTGGQLSDSSADGIASAYLSLAQQNDLLYRELESVAQSVKANVIPPLETLYSDLETHFKTLKSQGAKAQKEIEKSREATARGLEALGRATASGLHGKPDPKADAYILHRRVRCVAAEQIYRENQHSESNLNTQNTFASLEQHTIEVIQQSIAQLDQLRRRFYEAAAKSSSTVAQTFAAVDPTAEWQSFVSANAASLVPAQGFLRDPSKVTFANSDDASTKPLMEGMLTRKTTVLKGKRAGYYVLTPSGFLHEFKSADYVEDPTPELSLYIPDSQIGGIQPPASGDTSFKISSKDAGKVIGTRHKYSFLASSYDELLAWHQAISRVGGAAVDFADDDSTGSQGAAAVPATAAATAAAPAAAASTAAVPTTQAASPGTFERSAEGTAGVAGAGLVGGAIVSSETTQSPGLGQTTTYTQTTYTQTSAGATDPAVAKSTQLEESAFTSQVPSDLTTSPSTRAPVESFTRGLPTSPPTQYGTQFGTQYGTQASELSTPTQFGTQAASPQFGSESFGSPQVTQSPTLATSQFSSYESPGTPSGAAIASEPVQSPTKSKRLSQVPRYSISTSASQTPLGGANLDRGNSFGGVPLDKTVSTPEQAEVTPQKSIHRHDPSEGFKEANSSPHSSAHYAALAAQPSVAPATIEPTTESTIDPQLTSDDISKPVAVEPFSVVYPPSKVEDEIRYEKQEYGHPTSNVVDIAHPESSPSRNAKYDTILEANTQGSLGVVPDDGGRLAQIVTSETEVTPVQTFDNAAAGSTGTGYGTGSTGFASAEPTSPQFHTPNLEDRGFQDAPQSQSRHQHSTSHHHARAFSQDTGSKLDPLSSQYEGATPDGLGVKRQESYQTVPGAPLAGGHTTSDFSSGQSYSAYAPSEGASWQPTSGGTQGGTSGPSGSAFGGAAGLAGGVGTAAGIAGDSGVQGTESVGKYANDASQLGNGDFSGLASEIPDSSKAGDAKQLASGDFSGVASDIPHGNDASRIASDSKQAASGDLSGAAKDVPHGADVQNAADVATDVKSGDTSKLTQEAEKKSGKKFGLGKKIANVFK